MGHEVFLSHSSKDKAVADAVCAALESSGISCWIAPRDIVPGMDWSEALVRGIAECPVTLLIFSTAANDSVQVRREVQRAFEKDRQVLPFRIDDVVPSDALEYYLSPVHWLNAVVPPIESHFEELIQTVRRLLPAAAPTSPDEPASGTMPLTPVVTEAAPSGNLPVSMTPFIGRDAELNAWQELLLAPATRVLTLFGFGGMGKTRSALELATRCQADFPGGVWWVELEEDQAGQEMLHRIALTVGLSLKPQPSVRDQLIAFLRDRLMLITLDNIEQIPDAGAALNPLVQAAPRVKWLVTTRRALEIPAERVVEISPLSQEEAEALFIDRARGRQAGFERTEENAGDIAELCRRLEGMPLAIELAASRTAGMTPRDILNRLDEWFRLLQTRAPHLPPRQRALNGAIEWSHNLLTEDDKTLFAELAVFSSGFTLDAAEAVCDVFDVFEGVQELRKHSFLRTQTLASTQQMRFLMLELVREYAEQKLSGDEVRRRHAGFFLKFAEQQVLKLRTKDEAAALDRLNADRDNLGAALAWAHQGGQQELCARLALALGPLLYAIGLWSDAHRCFQTGLETVSGMGDAGRPLRAALCHESARLALDRGDRDAAREYATTGLGLYREIGATGGAAAALNLLGLLDLEGGAEGNAEARFQESRALWTTPEHRGRADTLHNLAYLASRRGETALAETLYAESLTERRAAGDVRGEAETLGNLGALAYNGGDRERARTFYLESVALRRTLRDRHGIALMLYNLGEIAEAEGDLDRAVALFAHADRILQELHSAYAGIAAETLERLRATLGEAAFLEKRQASLRTLWETLV